MLPPLPHAAGAHHVLDHGGNQIPDAREYSAGDRREGRRQGLNGC